MSLSLTYPGIYIQELAGPPPTITAAPTSITVFIGYTPPLKTPQFGVAIEIGSFSDYQRSFGGIYSNAWVDNDVPYAVQQFFLNGGSNAYVVGLQASKLAVFNAWTPPQAPPPVGPG